MSTQADPGGGEMAAQGQNMAMEGQAPGAPAMEQGPVAAGLIHIVHTLGILANSSRLLAYDLPGHRQGARRPEQD